MLGCCVVTNISWNMLFNSNLKALGSAPYISGITATLKFINQIALLEDSSNYSCIITVCNRGRNLIGNQLARKSKPRKFNINWAFVGPSGLMLFLNLLTVLLMVSTMTSSGYPLPKNKFLICSNSLLIL